MTRSPDTCQTPARGSHDRSARNQQPAATRLAWHSARPLRQRWPDECDRAVPSGPHLPDGSSQGGLTRTDLGLCVGR
jgi:hypothetical protein